MTSLSIQKFTEMVTEVGRAVDNTSTALQSSIKQHINNALAIAESANDWDQLKRVDESGLRDRADTTIKTLESGEAEAPMPWNARKITALFYQDSSVNPPELVTQDELYRRAGSSLNEQGRPQYAAVIGTTAQYKRLAASEIMKFGAPTSTNGSVPVRVHFIAGAGHVGNEMWEDMTAADWTTVTAMTAAVTAGWPITKVTLPDVWKDTFNGYRNDGTTRILSIERREIPLTNSNSNQITASRPLLRFWPVPDADYAMTVGYDIWHPRLVENDDTPLIPVSQFLVAKAVASTARQLGDSDRAQNADREASVALAALQRKSQPASRQFAAPFRGDILGMTGVR